MDAVLVLLVLQFLLAAVVWVGSAPLERFCLDRGPKWLQRELTRIVLPLLMIVAGLLFFSRPLSPVWGPALGLEGLSGFPAELGRGSFLVLNLVVTAILMHATGGTRHSPFTPLLPVVPLLGWAAGLSAVEVGAAVAGAGLLLWVGRRGRGKDAGPSWNRFGTGILTLAVLLVAFLLGGCTGP